jgi:hypothetical protein
METTADLTGYACRRVEVPTTPARARRFKALTHCPDVAGKRLAPLSKMHRHSSRRSIFALPGSALLVVFAASAAQAQEEGRIHLFGGRYSVIAGASVYEPKDEETRAIYGERAFAPVLDLWSFDTPAGLGISLDLGGQRLQQGERRADFLHGSFGPRIFFAPARAGFAPYLTLRGGIDVVHLDHSAWQGKPGGNVELGASVARRVVISARYDIVPKVAGVDLSGFGARLAVKVF